MERERETVCACVEYTLNNFAILSRQTPGLRATDEKELVLQYQGVKWRPWQCLDCRQ